MAQSYSLWQAVDAAVRLSVRAVEEVRALSRQQGPQGEAGKEGPPGKLERVKAWREGVFYEGDVITKDGNTFQALRDTGREPPHEDWICLAEKGVDGQSWTIRDTYDPAESYKAFDVVTVNATWFAAKKHNPGPCPGPDWKAGPTGRKGDRGDRGEKGPKGERGADGASIVGGAFDARGMKLVLERSDGGKLAIDMYDFALALKEG